MNEYKCIDCGETILFSPLQSGSQGKLPVISCCRCIDRETNKDKKVSGRVTEYKNYPTFVPKYMRK